MCAGRIEPVWHVGGITQGMLHLLSGCKCPARMLASASRQTIHALAMCGKTISWNRYSLHGTGLYTASIHCLHSQCGYIPAAVAWFRLRSSEAFLASARMLAMMTLMTCCAHAYSCVLRWLTSTSTCSTTSTWRCWNVSGWVNFEPPLMRVLVT